MNRQCLTANISKLGVIGLRKVSTFNQNFNGLIGKWLGNPSLLILANRCMPFIRGPEYNSRFANCKLIRIFAGVKFICYEKTQGNAAT